MLTPSTNLSDQIRAVVRQRIIEGDLAPDSRINEVHLAAELQVSRTPLREALTGLVAEGALTSIPRRGFFVRPLSAEEFRHIYPIRALLDPEALRLAGLPSPQRIARLERLNQRMEAAADVEERIRLDDAWHLELLADCPNPVLLELIQQFMLRTRRYELAYFRDPRHVQTASDDHRRLLVAAQGGDLEGAIEALRRNLTGGMAPILQWLETYPRAVEPETDKE
jgi:DNA-binding GntR family transcriptional regulator